MTDHVMKGEWVEVEREIIPVGERAPQVPEDTSKVSLQMRVKGYLLNDAQVGDEVEIETAIGRKEFGTLTEINPSYDHGYGAPIPELQKIGLEVRAILANKENV